MFYLLTLTCSIGEKDLLLAEVLESGAKGVEERDDPPARARLLAFYGDLETTKQAAALFPGREMAIETVDDVDWVALARSFWHPFPVGERFYLVPEWMGEPAPDERIRLTMFAGPAFGSGDHPTTILCLEALESLVDPGCSVLDVGTGSGILSIAALRLGAGRVFGCDIDHQAVYTARANCAMESARVHLFHGSIRSVRPDSVDIVVANINTAAIQGMAADLVAAARGPIALSGFSADNAGLVEEAIEKYGRKCQSIDTRDEWGCAIF